MRHFMSIESRRQLVNATIERYRKATKKEKAAILDELTASTCFGRKYAITLLNGLPKGVRESVNRPRSKRYGPYHEEALSRLWKIAGCVCSKRLVPALPDIIEALERHGQSDLLPQVRSDLLQISPASCDRLLCARRREHGKSTTSAGTLLKHSISIRTFSDWKDAENRPGYCEIDTVAHCGDTAAGKFAFTLTVTDIYSGWTIVRAIPNRGQAAVLAALQIIVSQLPFALLGLDSDNGGEFINWHLVKWCEENQITFTRGRPYKKNDQCYVEQKNWPAVRKNVGYRRYEGEDAVKAMNALYAPWNMMTNYFIPSLKLRSKERSNGKVLKRYEEARTAYRRIMECEKCSDEMKERMTQTFRGLNPALLQRQIVTCQQRLASLPPVVSAEVTE